MDPWVVSHAYGQSEPQQWLQLNVCFIFGVCEVFNWGILVLEILAVMQVEDPSTNPISTSSAGYFIVASSRSAYVAQAVEALFCLQVCPVSQ